MQFLTSCLTQPFRVAYTVFHQIEGLILGCYQNTPWPQSAMVTAPQPGRGTDVPGGILGEPMYLPLYCSQVFCP